jgi:hypothetical protein
MAKGLAAIQAALLRGSPTVFPAIAPTIISNRAAEIVIQSDPMAATNANAIHNAD